MFPSISSSAVEPVSYFEYAAGQDSKLHDPSFSEESPSEISNPHIVTLTNHANDCSLAIPESDADESFHYT